jgi:hypothetical protein
MSDQTTKPKSTTPITSSMYWWLSLHRPFIINDEYKLELLELKRGSGTVKIKVTNLKTNEVVEVEQK